MFASAQGVMPCTTLVRGAAEVGQLVGDGHGHGRRDGAGDQAVAFTPPSSTRSVLDVRRRSTPTTWANAAEAAPASPTATPAGICGSPLTILASSQVRGGAPLPVMLTAIVPCVP